MTAVDDFDTYWEYVQKLTPDEQDKELIKSIKGDDINKVDLLIEHVGADRNTTDASGNTAIAIASSHGYLVIVNRLLDMDTNPDIKNYAGETALMLAVVNGHARVVKRLIEGSAKKDIQNNKGKTALDYAREKNNTEIIALLQPKSIASVYDNLRPPIRAAASGSGMSGSGRRKRTTRKHRGKKRKQTKHRKSVKKSTRKHKRVAKKQRGKKHTKN